ncbi:MAG: V-type ATP synthase subunit D [Planctomycetaceae bacterium]|jgi:V/A-type H+/Na+-transporting ATPase subunit D|nr:V-type ATP synthase subunit D [Planctomycetaceae bacterium]
MKLALNKTTLKRTRDELKTYKKFLPSLDLKRQQLLAALKVARAELAESETVYSELEALVSKTYPLLGSSTMRTRNLGSLIRVEEVVIVEENLVGTRLPVAKAVRFALADYSRMVMPFWVDLLIDNLKTIAEQRILLQVRRQRVKLLDHAARKITQRVNLFEKVLIPQSEASIRKIVIFLSDQERAAVVRSKIAKNKASKKER